MAKETQVKRDIAIVLGPYLVSKFQDKCNQIGSNCIETYLGIYPPSDNFKLKQSQPC